MNKSGSIHFHEEMELETPQRCNVYNHHSISSFKVIRNVSTTST